MHDWCDLGVDGERPLIRCLVAFYCEPWGLITSPRVVVLEEAVDYARFGFICLVDPDDESDLARWLQWQRVIRETRR